MSKSKKSKGGRPCKVRSDAASHQRFQSGSIIVTVEPQIIEWSDPCDPKTFAPRPPDGGWPVRLDQ